MFLGQASANRHFVGNCGRGALYCAQLQQARAGASGEWSALAPHSATASAKGDEAKIKLSRLREIGWSLWDPIGLREASDGEWRDGGRCADEYDGYLLQAAGRLRRGEPTSRVAAYLVETETVHIGLSLNETTRSRAAATVAAIKEYLESLPPGPLNVR